MAQAGADEHHGGVTVGKGSPNPGTLADFAVEADFYKYLREWCKKDALRVHCIRKVSIQELGEKERSKLLDLLAYFFPDIDAANCLRDLLHHFAPDERMSNPIPSG